MKLSIVDNNEVKLSVGDPDGLSLSAGEVVNIGADLYEGSYEWTPAATAQTIPINGLQAKADIVIKPIPNNYGLVTYDGSTITVS